MAKQYLLGIDGGLTNLKAVLFDTDGKMLAVAKSDSKVSYPKPGWVECDPRDIWSATADCIRSILKTSGISPEEIAAIGACAWGTGAILLDAEGQPSYPAIASSDARTASLVEQLMATPAGARAAQINKVGAATMHPVVIARWLKDNEPAAYANTSWVCACKDYINFKLTGLRRQEPNDVSGAGWYAWETQDYAYEIFELFGVPEMKDKVAPLMKESAQIIGGVSPECAAETGLAAGTPVIAGMMDITACAIGTGIQDETKACAIVGTWSINEVVCADKFFDNTIATLVHAFDGKILSNCGGCTSATNTEWFLRCFGREIESRAKEAGRNVYDMMTDLAETVPAGGTNVIYLPFISSPSVHLYASAGFHNILADTTLEELLHALYEGITFDHRRYMEIFIHQGHEIAAYRLAGGGAKSDYWSQMFADVLGRPVEVVQASELGALGCCITAGISAGIFSSFDDACAHMLGECKTFYPIPENQEKYQKQYEKWTDTVRHMCAFWDQKK